jgi:hypothetical protein
MHTPEPAFEHTEPLHIMMLNRRHVLDRLRLGPRWYPVEQHFGERPDLIGQSCCHRRCTRPPHLRCATAVGDLGDRQRLAQTGVGQHEVVLDVEQPKLIPQARFALA